MQRIDKDGLSYLTYDLLANHPEVIHGTFLTPGGISQGPFKSLNFGLATGDLEANVLENKRRALGALNIKTAKAIFQVHGNTIHHLQHPEEPLVQADGLMTQTKGLGLLIKHADCQSAIFYDPTQKAIANIHCGWKGAVSGIYQEAILKLKSTFGSNPANLLVCISPSLGPEASEFRNYETEFPREFWQFQVKPTYFDLWEVAKWQLTQAGILPHHIEIAKMCTYQNKDDCFSYRREKLSGRHATIVALTEV